VPVDGVADRGDIDPFFRASADHWNVDAFHQHGSGSIGDRNYSQPAVNSGIDAKE
jgi:hypothetical protein